MRKAVRNVHKCLGLEPNLLLYNNPILAVRLYLAVCSIAGENVKTWFHTSNVKFRPNPAEYLQNLENLSDMVQYFETIYKTGGIR
jgi:hypothetical protein